MTAPAPTLLVKNARLATMTGRQAALGDAPLGLVESGALLCAGERLLYAGPEAGLPALPQGLQVIDAAGQLLAPGFIEPHSHLLFGGDRAHEFALRMEGKSYLEIAQAGGGIRSTVRATRQESDDALVAGAQRRLARLVRGGCTTVEVKSGYGLSVAHELRMLQLIQRAAQGAGCEVIPTLLGLHAVPEEMTREEWLRAVVSELTPEVARQGLARGCDAFCEQGAFTADECRAALQAGAQAGLLPHLHADQLSQGGGAELAASLGCASADHLERASPAGIEAMARAGTVATLLPLAAWFMREKQPAQAAPFLTAGVTVALGGNLNPGSQRMEGVSLVLAAGCLISGLTPQQALWAYTAGAAQALRLADRGRLVAGLRADFVLFSTREPAHLAYHAGVDHAQLVVRGGQVVPLSS